MSPRWYEPVRIAGKVLDRVYVEPVRSDRLRIANWPPGLLIMAACATVGYAAAAGLAIGAPWLRHWLPMVATNDVAGMPTFVPGLTAALLGLAAVLGQTGALHAPIPLRILVLLASLAIMVRLGSTLDGAEQLALTLGPWLALVILQVLRWRFDYRWWEYAVVAASYSLALLGAAQGTSRGAAYGGGSSVDAIYLTMETVTIMVAPLAMIAGYAIASWAFGLVLWTAEFSFGAGRRAMPTWVLAIVLVGLTGWRLVVEWRDFLKLSITARLIIYPGIMIAGSVLIWIAVDKIADRMNPGDTRVQHLDDDIRRVAFPAAIGLLASVIFDSLITDPLRSFADVAPVLDPALKIINSIGSWLGGDAYGIGFSAAMIIWGGWLAWRGARGRAEIAATIGLGFGLTRISQLSIAGGGFAVMLITAIGILLVLLLVTGRLDRARIEGMIIIVGFAVVISEREFFADPVSSIVGGAVPLFLGLVWQFLTSGGEANGESRRWPKPSRVLMVLGFNLLGMVVLGFAAITYQTDLTLDDMQGYGDKLLGGPLLLGAAIATALSLRHSHGREWPAPTGDEAPATVSA